MIATESQMATTLDQLLDGQFGLVQLPPESLLSEADRQHTLDRLRQTPFTFELEPYPPCWGKAFENYLSMEEYFAPHDLDASIANLGNPITEKIVAMLAARGIRVEAMLDPVRNLPYTLGDFRINAIVPHDSILHVDDLQLDSVVKSDFVLPTILQGNNYVQLSVLLMLEADRGEATLRTYDRKYVPADDQYRLANGWQFSDDAVAGAAYHDYRPQTGDAFIMTNQYFHDIIGAAQADAWCMYSLYILYLPDQGLALLYI